MTDAPRADAHAALAEAEGLFGPGSVSWRIDRELVVLAGGSCALLMQAAHPVVAAGVAQHSTYATDPFGRLMRTLQSTFSVVFGTRSEAEATIRRINAIHASVRGTRPDTGTAYSALEPEPLLWVHATLVDTALRVYERFVAPLTPEERQAYHEESARVAVLLGVPPAIIPPTLVELRAWMARLLEDGRVHVTPAARDIAGTVLHPMPRTPRLAWEAAHLVSVSTLPPVLRQQYRLRWSRARERGVERMAALSRLVLPRVPGMVRFAPQARAAQRRLRRAA
ncbi:MAG TPA: oxygenase MpaB family protein [Candidatus Limnocylindria bacterium]|nr:oxygenase MpaB family protein [Candidatus Limnocylindria bacterium]